MYGDFMTHRVNSPEEVQGPAAADPNYARRWWILGLLGTAQLMVVLDATIVNIALPQAQAALGFNNSDRQSASTAASPGSARRSGCCSAASSPST
jgi:hypothetical protein